MKPYILQNINNPLICKFTKSSILHEFGKSILRILVQNTASPKNEQWLKLSSKYLVK